MGVYEHDHPTRHVFTQHGFEPNYSIRTEGERIAEVGPDEAITAAEASKA